MIAIAAGRQYVLGAMIQGHSKVTDTTLDTRLIGVFLALALLTLIAGVPAGRGMHLRLLRSAPVADATVTESPGEIRLWYSETPELAVSRVRLEGPGGRVALGDLALADDDSLAAPLNGALPAGEYTVSWGTASADGHPIRGTFVFSVASPGFP